MTETKTRRRSNVSWVWHENKQQFSKLSNINHIWNFKQNLIEDFFQQNKWFNSTTCYVCKRIKESKDDFSKKRLKRLKRVKDIITHKWCQKSAQIKKMLKNARFVWNFISFTLHKAFFFFNITDKYPACKKTNFGYTASYIRQALPELARTRIIMSYVGPGGILNVTHLDLSYIRWSIYDSTDMISHF